MSGRERFFDYDPLTGSTEYFSYDEVTDTFTIRREDDLEPVLALNAEHRKQEHGPSGNWKGEMHLVGSIPLSVYYEELVKTGRIHSQSELKRWWNSSDREVFKTKRGWI